jgi:hypothetical protein
MPKPVARRATASRQTRSRSQESESTVLRRAERIARLSDDRFRLPGTRFHFGADALVGLVPVIGDIVMAGVSVLILHQAWRAGAPRGLLLTMAGNVAIDTIAGAIPVAGDVFDFTFKANRRNARLLKAYLAATAMPRAKGLLQPNGVNGNGVRKAQACQLP